MRGVKAATVSLGLFVVVALAACGAGPSAAVCNPGASDACVCTNGASGAQVCNPQGTGFDTCVCDSDAEGDAVGGGDIEADEQGASTGSWPPPVGEWSAVEPGGDTICARGTPFRFYVYGGDPNRIVMDFLGGGACWDSFSCEVGREIQGQSVFTDSAGTLEELQAMHEAGELEGIYALDNPDNPYKGWTMIRVPYCTGDFYWGNATVDYTDTLKVHHRGFDNAKAVTAWVTGHYPDVTRLVASGCEAGAYGSLNQAMALADFYPEATVAALADSGVGVITESFFADAFMIWNAFSSMPLHLDGLAGKALEDVTVKDVTIAASNSHPNLRVAQYTTAYDVLQSFHYMFMGGAMEDWHAAALSSLEYIRARAPNFRYYLAPGPIHCVTPHDITYSREVNGVRFSDWLKVLSTEEVVPPDVVCEGDGCRDDPLCAGCQDGSIESVVCGWCDGWSP
ncbi:MAG: pectin acetylesterase-family hydrolase [Myxococcota bacterium]